MHTDMPGAAVTIIKNPSGLPVPPITLNEAAVFEVCHSRAWEAKIITEVYWVQADQVSKTPPTGLYISTGSFIIRGKRNFITPPKLELGFTLMFSLSPECIANHVGERKPRNQVKNDEEDETSVANEGRVVKEDYSNPQAEEPELVKQESSKSNFDDEPYSVVQVGEDKEEMLRLQKMKYERKQQAKQRDAAAKEAKNNKVDAFAQKKGGNNQQ